MRWIRTLRRCSSAAGTIISRSSSSATPTDDQISFSTSIRSIGSLTTQYGFDEAHIFALYGNGAREDAGDPGSPALPGWIDGPGTKAQLASAIASVGGAWVPNDGFFFWASNHGLESTVPEPATILLVTIGGAVVLVVCRGGETGAVRGKAPTGGGIRRDANSREVVAPSSSAARRGS